MSEGGKREYAALADYARIRTEELSSLLGPFADIIDRYGGLLCGVVLILGKTPPASPRDAAIRDLIADVFDFLHEAHTLIIKGKLEVAYPLARRAYESLSLLVACQLEPTLADRWIAGTQISNADVRRILAAHSMGEKEDETRELYRFFSKTTHPNRTHMACRHLGEGNEFVLGAIGKPSLAMLADYALKALNLWFWFAAFVIFTYREILIADPVLMKTYHDTAETAKPIAAWLVEQFNHALAQEQAEQYD